MLVVYSPEHRQHNPRFELYDGQKSPYPELPDRLEAIVHGLQRDRRLDWLIPLSFEDETLLRLQSPRYVDYVRKMCLKTSEGQEIYPSNFIHDSYAPLTNGTFAAARTAAATALTAARSLLAHGQTVYALCRPPGHHAGDGFMGGYCYFNNAALAADELSAHGRVAIIDIDYHHGNGTQLLFYGRDDVLYVSLHADPAENYPYTHGFTAETGSGAGVGFTHNFPVQKNCGWSTYRQTFLRSLTEVKNFAPDYLVVSLGFDGYKDDPIAGFGLDIVHFGKIARLLGALQLPTLLIQEGGYCIEALGDLASTFVSNFESKS